MNKIKIFPNFWQALLYYYVLPLVILAIIIFPVIIFHFEGIIPNELFLFSRNFGHIFTIPVVFFFLWRGKIKISWSDFTNINVKKILIVIILTVGAELIFLGTISSLEKLFNRHSPSFSTQPLELDYISVISPLVFGPIVEEILYRRIFLHQFLKQYSVWIAIALSSFLFVIPHGPVMIHPELFIPYFVSGIFLGLVYYKTQSISLCIIAHSIMNLITYLPIDNIFK